MKKHELVNQDLKNIYIPKVSTVAQLVRDGSLTREEGELSLAGALLKIWDSHNYKPVSVADPHEIALHNAKSDLKSALEP